MAAGYRGWCGVHERRVAATQLPHLVVTPTVREVVGPQRAKKGPACRYRLRLHAPAGWDRSWGVGPAEAEAQLVFVIVSPAVEGSGGCDTARMVDASADLRENVSPGDGGGGSRAGGVSHSESAEGPLTPAVGGTTREAANLG